MYMRFFLFAFIIICESITLNAQTLSIYRKQGDCVSFDINEVDSLKFAPEMGTYSFNTDYVRIYDNLSSILSGIKTNDRKLNYNSNKYVDLILSQYNSYEKIQAHPIISPAISLSDDDTFDSQLDGPLTSNRTGGFFSTLFPLAASLDAHVTEAVEGHRCGLNVGKLSTAGCFAKLLSQHAGWELANHTMDARYGLALPVKTYADIPSADKIPAPTDGVLTYRKYVYVEDENKCYKYEDGWIPVEDHKDPPYLMNASGRAISDNPCYDFEYEVWYNQDMMEKLMGARPITYVQPVNQSSRKRAEYVKASHKYMMNLYSDKPIELPLATTIGRMSLDDAEGTSNEATDDLFEKWKKDLNDVLENNQSIVLLLHTYRSCWSNELKSQLKSNGGSYPDAWVYPTNLPTLNLIYNYCSRFQNNTFLDYVMSNNYDCVFVRIANDISKIVLEGVTLGGFHFFSSNRFSSDTYLGYNQDGIVPENANFAFANLKKSDNPKGYEKLTLKYSVPITYNHCARIVPDGTYSKFRDYVDSQNYDCIHININTAVNKIKLTGVVASGYLYFSSSQFGEETFIGSNYTGEVPEGAKYAIVNLKKEDNLQGYNLLVEDILDMSSVEWLKPNDSTGIESWSEWYPCPGTRLYQLWKLLKYAKDKGVSFLTISQNLDRMANKVEGGYFVRNYQNAFDKFDTDYYIEDLFGNIYLHRSK